MAKLVLILLEDDSDYVQSVRDYVAARDDAEQIAVKQFTKAEPALQSLEAASGHAVLVVAEHLWPAVEGVRAPVVLLLERPTDTGRIPSGAEMAFKYEPLERLLLAAQKARTVDTSLSGGGRTGLKGGRGQTRVVSWFSAAGGSGKTTAAYNLAVLLAQRGEKVCLVNLESLPTGIGAQRDERSTMAEWLYYAKMKPRAAIERAADLVRPGEHRNLHVAALFAHPDDALEMGAAEAELLLDALCRLQTFAWIVVDLDAGWSARNRGAFARSEKVFWIVTDDAACLGKTAALLDICRAEGKGDWTAACVIFAAGKYVGLAPSGYDRIGVEPSLVLPYVPQWKTVKQPEELLKAVFYSQTLWEGFHSAMQLGGGRDPGWNSPILPH